MENLKKLNKGLFFEGVSIGFLIQCVIDRLTGVKSDHDIIFPIFILIIMCIQTGVKLAASDEQ